MNRIKELRKEYDMTSAQLAEHLEVTEEKIATYEAGQIIPLEERLDKMSQLFECSVDYLMGRTYKRKWETETIAFSMIKGEFVSEEDVLVVRELIEKIKREKLSKQ